DIRGKRYFRDDGRPASVWDILRDPLLLTRQGRRLPEEVYSGFLGDGNRYGVYGNWHYFQGSTMTVVNNYYVDDMAGWKMKAALVTDEIISTMGRVSAEKASQAEPHFRKFWE
ncbi:MAG: hypothetical protein U9N45_06740, partial [Gemmatimonadota bacterium]|nr:hypothetical protein [Gemmatimonadota bacterium]